ncbi:hypothetical protein QEN41_16290 [Gordonia alkanivorans]|uniref:hypothetical protein n=1 Tax=Gordonia alkanivorans TaxID=84096 RepID=UPI00244CAC95|nr:hypothetical protein [Gordonia alkanivorans]MDH3021542.1 hypothetical protein [Gordonia alkanivorans]
MTTTLAHSADTEHQAIARAAAGLGIHVEIPENVRSARQVHAEASPGDGGIELVATLTSGRAYANVERFDYSDSDGTPTASGLEVSIFLPGGNRDTIGEGKVGFSSDDAGRIALLRDVAVSSAAASFVDAYTEATSAEIEVR